MTTKNYSVRKNQMTLAEIIAAKDYNYFITVSPQFLVEDGQKIRPSINDKPRIEKFVEVLSSRINKCARNVNEQNGTVYEGLHLIAIPDVLGKGREKVTIHYHMLVRVDTRYEADIILHIMKKSPVLSEKILGYATYPHIAPINNITAVSYYVTKNFWRPEVTLDFIYRSPEIKK